MDELYLSNRVKSINESLLWKFFNLANSVEDVISLSVGEPDFKTPWHISDEGMYAIEKGRTYYSPTTGLNQLRDGILKYYQRRFNVFGYTRDNVLVTVGASEGIDLVCRCCLDDGDEVIVLDPGYIAYEPSVIISGGVPVALKLEESNGFKVTPAQLEKVITDKTKMIILNYPSNPTGGVMNYEDYQAIVPVLKRHHILTVCDEIYAELVYDCAPQSIGVFKDIQDQLVILNGFSKAYSMTGWRLGYMIAPVNIINGCNSMHQYTTMSPSTITQFAGIEAVSIRGDKDIEEHRQSFKMRRNFIVAQLNKMGLPTPMPSGAFYVFANITSCNMDSYTFCEKLLQEKKVCIIPGTAFGPSGEGFVRISYAYSIDNLKKACALLSEFVAKYQSKK